MNNYQKALSFVVTHAKCEYYSELFDEFDINSTPWQCSVILNNMMLMAYGRNTGHAKTSLAELIIEKNLTKLIPK